MLWRAKLFLVTVLFAATANATIWTDLWWVPTESGWGVNIVQQGNRMFLTGFVYGPDSLPTWYVAALAPGAVLPNGYARWEGDLYETRGPWFGAPFDPANASGRKVGTTSFVPSSLVSAKLEYSVDGVPVSKAIQRQTFWHVPIGANYVGGYSVGASSCPRVPVGGYGIVQLEVTATVNADGATGSIATTIILDGSAVCNLSGTYRQYGSVYAVKNNAACRAGIGDIDYTDLSLSDEGVDGNISIIGFGGCSIGLTFSAVSR